MRRLSAFIWAGLIGTLGGLIGLGGAEFRLRVLIGIYQFPALQAIAINLIVILVTVVLAFVGASGYLQGFRSVFMNSGDSTKK